MGAKVDLNLVCYHEAQSMVDLTERQLKRLGIRILNKEGLLGKVRIALAEHLDLEESRDVNNWLAWCDSCQVAVLPSGDKNCPFCGRIVAELPASREAIYLKTTKPAE